MENKTEILLPKEENNIELWYVCTDMWIDVYVCVCVCICICVYMYIYIYV